MYSRQHTIWVHKEWDAGQRCATVPILQRFFSTCKSNPTVEEYSNIQRQAGKLVKQYDEYGEADEDFLDSCHIKRDTGPRGEEIVRDAKALHLRRATVINHVAICERRNQDLQQARDAQLSKMEEANTKHQEKVQANQDAVQRLLQSAEKEGRFGEAGCPCYSDESNLEYCTMQDFGKLTCPMLKAFIVAHHPELKRMKDIPKKGTMKEAEEHNAHNAILMAYKCRMSQNLLEGNMPHSAEDIARMTCGVAEEQDGENVMTVRLEELDLVKPSSLLECSLWRANAVRLFGLQARSEGLRVDPGAEVSEEKKVTANKLVLILRSRFKIFLKQRIKEKARRDHWCMRFALKNLPVLPLPWFLADMSRTMYRV